MDRNNNPGSRRGSCPRAKLQTTDWLADVTGNDDSGVIEVIFKNTRTGYYLNPENLRLRIGDMVAVESQPGYDVGRVNMTGPLVNLQMRKSGVKEDAELRNVLHKATQEEMSRAAEAYSREHDTMIRARKIAEDLSLNMKIGDVEYQADAAKAIFYYIADERVDFRTLIRVLADTFKVRVEMRQIGARQEAGRIGGIGPCGRQLCCSQWMTRFVSVGTGAARIQDLSMNPQKLAGQCAKLKCCLNFETPVYAEAQRELPGKDIQLETKDNTYYYFKPDILARTVTYSTDKRIPANLVTIPASRAFEVIALNNSGIKPDALLANGSGDASKSSGYADLLEQENINRFDKSKKKKNKKSQPAAQQKRNKQQSAEQSKKTEQPKKSEGHSSTPANGPKDFKKKAKPRKTDNKKTEK